MPVLKIIGVVCIGIGVFLFVRGHDMAHSIGGEMQNAFTGSPGSEPAHLYVGGIVAVLVGLFLISFKKK